MARDDVDGRAIGQSIIEVVYRERARTFELLVHSELAS